MKKEMISFTGRVAAVYRDRHLDINQQTYDQSSSYEEELLAFQQPYQAADGTWINPVEDWFPLPAKVGMPGPGIKGWPAPTEGGSSCNLNDFQRVSAVRDLAYKGRWSLGARKRFRKCCDILFQAAIQTWEKHPSKDVRFPFQIAFLTLTIPQEAGYISPKDAHKSLLKPFIRWLRETHLINGYVWVREFQKNGMIHYHLVYDKFILKTSITRKWNKLMKDAGYLEDWYKNNPGKTPPSTRVDKAQNPEQCAWYMQKYMSKAMKDNDKKEENGADDGVDRSGKLWDASMNLKAGKAFAIEFTPLLKVHLDKQVEASLVDRKEIDYVVLYFARHGNLLQVMPKNVQQAALVHYRQILYEGTPLAPAPV